VWALEEVGCKYELEYVDLERGAQKEGPVSTTASWKSAASARSDGLPSRRACGTHWHAWMKTLLVN
jgi:hypothetical protein